MRGIVKGGLNDGGSNIKSIQRGTYSGSATNTNITISTVDVSKSIVTVSNAVGVGNSPNENLYVGKLTAATTLNLTRNDGAGSMTVYWTVIEFNNVKSFQEGDVTLSSGGSETTVTVSAVDTNKAILFAAFKHNSGTGSSEPMLIQARVISTTQLGFMNRSATAYVHWQLIEFY